LFWYDFLVGDAWDIALGVVAVLAAFGLVAGARPGSTELLGPLLALAVIGLTWMSLRRATGSRGRAL
jgi:hypothetical protein